MSFMQTEKLVETRRLARTFYDNTPHHFYSLVFF